VQVYFAQPGGQHGALTLAGLAQHLQALQQEYPDRGERRTVYKRRRLLRQRLHQCLCSTAGAVVVAGVTIVESIAFDKNGGTDTHTRSFLVGTSVGCVFEVCLDRDGKEKVNNQVFHLDEPLPITSLHFEYVGNMDDANRQLLMTSAAAAGDTRILVLCATTAPSAAPTTSAQGQTPVPSSNTRMYTFYGGPTFAQLFTDVMNRGKASYNDLPGDIKRAELHFYTDKPSQQQPAAARASTKANKQTFALMTEMGIYHGSAKFPSSVSSKRFGTDSVYCNLDESYNVCFYLDVQRLFGRIDGMDVDALCDAVR
jgi:hypothetical protein